MVALKKAFAAGVLLAGLAACSPFGTYDSSPVDRIPAENEVVGNRGAPDMTTRPIIGTPTSSQY